MNREIMEDYSLLRKPVKTNFEGFEEALRAYDSENYKVKNLLLKECDLVFECKLCLNIFRNHTNFISHKRLFCQSLIKRNDHFICNTQQKCLISSSKSLAQADPMKMLDYESLLSNYNTQLIILACQLCDLKFKTIEMLRNHVEMKHMPSSFVFLCSFCTQIFPSPTAVIQHLSIDHEKSNRQIRLMRNCIKRVRADEVSISSSDESGISIGELNTINMSESTTFDEFCSEIEVIKKRKTEEETEITSSSSEAEENPIEVSENETVGGSYSKRKKLRTATVGNKEITESQESIDDSIKILDWCDVDIEEVIKKDIIFVISPNCYG